MSEIHQSEIKSTQFINNMIIRDQMTSLNRWTAQLLKSIKNVNKKNELKYEAIVKHNSQFSIKLFKPQITTLPMNVSEISGQALLKQLDFLLDDQSKLDNEIKKINFEKQEHQLLRQIQIDSQMDHYSFLRSIWKRDLKETNLQDRIQRLNNNVGSIKGHINTLIYQQSRKKNFEFSQAVIESQQYEILKEKYERLRMFLEDEFTKAIKINSESYNMKKYQEEINVLREKLTNQEEISKSFKGQTKELKDKLFQLSQLLKQKENKEIQNKRFYYQYQFEDDLTIKLTANEINENKAFETTKTIKEIHDYLTSSESKEGKTFKNLQRQNQGLKNRYNHLRNQIDAAKKVRHIRGVQEMKSADFKKPKFIRSSAKNDEKAEERKKKINK